jgi:DNA-binding NarL/FixJ family response regulator
VRSGGPVTVAVGQLGSVIGRGLLEILEDARGLRVVGAGLDHAALEGAVARGRAQVVVLDEDSVAGPSVPRRLCGARSGVGLVVLAHRPSRAYVTRVLACGVSVCLSTDASAVEIVRGVGVAADGRHVFVSVSARPVAAGRAVGIGALTRREREVLELLSQGQKNAEIAGALRISTETARSHAKQVYRKLGVSSRGELLGIEQ